MNRDVFDDTIGGVFATYQRPAPRAEALEEIFSQIEGYSDDFWFYAVEQLKAMEKLPANLGRYIRLTVYPAWCHALSAAGAAGAEGCRECGGTGWHMVWMPGDTAAQAPAAVPCICNALAEALWDCTPMRWTKAALAAAGYSATPPKPAKEEAPLDRAAVRAMVERAAMQEAAYA